MKASNIIEQLQKDIESRGDFEIYSYSVIDKDGESSWTNKQNFNAWVADQKSFELRTKFLNSKNVVEQNEVKQH